MKKNFIVPDANEHQNQLQTFEKLQKEAKQNNNNVKKDSKRGESPDESQNTPSAGESK